MTDLNDFLNTEFSEKDRAEIQQLADEMILDTGLQLLREELALSQKAVAEAMGVKQPRITQIEQGGADQRLITIKRYIEAMGGKLSLLIELPDGSGERTLRV
ncbi:helix-turn-helix domain-containing protein [Pantoea cypripedii]|uniref:Transcriptional regulator n=1 Tax=Pantoea cypripedii TaxID=55209 RepID=A0A1X1ELR2_PANCY|nr:helix-turn-helix transcriptional regulator [Pantoea cypripedii]MBP2200175.1 transcriptional regulator with XRE-family HTH domain [Pantoea cypripedii]ORM89773.1 transcriptional regulator [Pantoea cypripedii]